MQEIQFSRGGREERERFKKKKRRDTGSIPGWKDPLEKQKATHSGILARKLQWTEELDTTEHFHLKGRVCHHLHFQPFSLSKGTHTHTHTHKDLFVCA